MRKSACAVLAMFLLTTGTPAEEVRLVGIGWGCLEADPGWRVTITASGVDSFAGHVEPEHGEWRVNWLTGMWEELLRDSERSRVLSKSTVTIGDHSWSAGLVERKGRRYRVVSDGFVQFMIPAVTPHAEVLLRAVATRYRSRTAAMSCESPMEAD